MLHHHPKLPWFLDAEYQGLAAFAVTRLCILLVADDMLWVRPYPEPHALSIAVGELVQFPLQSILYITAILLTQEIIPATLALDQGVCKGCKCISICTISRLCHASAKAEQVVVIQGST